MSSVKQPVANNESKDLSLDFDSVISVRRDTLNADLHQIQSSRETSGSKGAPVQAKIDDELPKHNSKPE